MTFVTIEDDDNTRMVEENSGWELMEVSTDIVGREKKMRLRHVDGNEFFFDANKQYPPAEGWEIDWKVTAFRPNARNRRKFGLSDEEIVDLATRAMQDFAAGWGHNWGKPIAVKVSVRVV